MLDLKEAIRELKSRSRTITRRDGSVEWTFSGNVHFEVREAILRGHQEGRLEGDLQNGLVAHKGNCSVSFRFRNGHSVQNWVGFVYTDASW